MTRTMALLIGVLVCTSLFLAFKMPMVNAIPVDNGVEGEPVIECGPDAIEVTFKTRNAFNGRLYVKGRYGQGGMNSFISTLFFSNLSFYWFEIVKTSKLEGPSPASHCHLTHVVCNDCAHCRLFIYDAFTRKWFVTKVDRVYHVQCFYMESQKNVNQQVQVSDITTAFITQLVPMPVCRYEILEGGPSGTPIQFAVVGMQVYHKWTCDTETEQTFCMIVHSCFVEDGTDNNTVQMVDEHGCALDKYLLNNLEYPTDLSAGQEAHIFKYADKSSLFFQCQISITLKDDECPRPECEEPKRGKRHIEQRVFTSEQLTIDVSSQQINTMDHIMDDGWLKRKQNSTTTNSLLGMYTDRTMNLLSVPTYCFHLDSLFLVVSAYLAFVTLSTIVYFLL